MTEGVRVKLSDVILFFLRLVFIVKIVFGQVGATNHIDFGLTEFD